MPSAEENLAAIEAFLKSCRQPALLEPGEELIPLTDNYAVDVRGERLTIQAWDRTRNLARRVMGLEQTGAGKLQLTVQRFAKREGELFLVDLSRKSGADLGKKSGRLVFRERMRIFLRRQFPQWKLVEMSSEANLQYSLSPAYPRAFLKYGQHGWAAIGCPPDGDAAAVVTYALIWLDYLRAREIDKVVVEGLAIYVPAGRERQAALRVLCLHSERARYEVFSYSHDDFIDRVDPRDHGNLDTRLQPCRRPDPNRPGAWDEIAALPGVERLAKHDGRLSLRIRGLEFGEIENGEMRFGLDERTVARPHHVSEIRGLVAELDRARADCEHPLYRHCPEAWLESEVRSQIETLEASILPDPIYGQVPAFTAGDRGVLDLLGVDRTGRLAVIELKASEDPHLPLQALDYWIRVKWHLDRGEFPQFGYFPGLELRPEPPRLFLISPSLEFHPTTETVLSYFSPLIDVERIGVGVEWRKGLQVMFRLSGAQRPK